MSSTWTAYDSLSAVSEELVSQPVCFPAACRRACFGTEHTHNGSRSPGPFCNTAVPSGGGSGDNGKHKRINQSQMLK